MLHGAGSGEGAPREEALDAGGSDGVGEDHTDPGFVESVAAATATVLALLSAVLAKRQEPHLTTTHRGLISQG